jgi:hypothetical protein
MSIGIFPEVPKYEQTQTAGSILIHRSAIRRWYLISKTTRPRSQHSRKTKPCLSVRKQPIPDQLFLRPSEAVRPNLIQLRKEQPSPAVLLPHRKEVLHLLLILPLQEAVRPVHILRQPAVIRQHLQPDPTILPEDDFRKRIDIKVKF